jgi:hypothetical protein
MFVHSVLLTGLLAEVSGDQEGEKGLLLLVPSFCSVLRSHPFAPAARCIRRRVEWRSRTRG